MISHLENSSGLLDTSSMGRHIVDWMPDGRSSGHQVIRTPGHQVIRSSGHRVIGSHRRLDASDGSESDETVARHEFTASKHMSVSNAFCARGLDILSTMMAAAGRMENASKFGREAAALRKALMRSMWNGTAFCDGVCSEVRSGHRRPRTRTQY